MAPDPFASALLLLTFFGLILTFLCVFLGLPALLASLFEKRKVRVVSCSTEHQNKKTAEQQQEIELAMREVEEYLKNENL